MLHAHPRIDRDTVRVRFSDFGESSLDISVRVYALTREWNDFHAIQEDVLFRIHDLVRGSGTDFAFPSSTVYMGQDSGIDSERGSSTIDEVARWRRRSELTFPQIPLDELDRLEGTLDYPPKGSAQAAGGVPEQVIATEGLAAANSTNEPLGGDRAPEAKDPRRDDRE